MIMENATQHPVDVTVLIAAYDRLSFLKEAVASALAQDYGSFEVLVIDDGSGQETRDWLDEQANSENHLRVIHQQNSGIARARQAGLIAARGQLVCILDSDDRFLPGALRSIMAFFIASTPVDLVYTNNMHQMPSGVLRNCTYPHYATNRAMIRGVLLRPRIPFKHSGTTFCRDVALDLGGYDAELPIKVDVDLYLRFLAAGRKLCLLDAPVVAFRVHKNSVSRRRLLGIRVWCQLIDRYGPRSRLARIGYKASRVSAELLKLATERVQCV